MSLFSKIGNFLSGSVGQVVNTVGKIAASTGIPIVSQIGKGLDLLIPDSQQKKMVDAVERDGVIKVDEIENTLMALNPNLSSTELVSISKAVTEGLSTVVPNASISDSNAVTNISFIDKVIAFVNKYKWYVLGVLGFIVLYSGGFLRNFGLGGGRRSYGRRSYRRY